MILPLLHTLSGILIFAFLGGKIVLHYRLNALHGRNPGWRSFVFTPLDYFLPYELKVKPEHESMKRSCNKLLWGVLWAVIANFIIGLMEFWYR